MMHRNTQTTNRRSRRITGTAQVDPPHPPPPPALVRQHRVQEPPPIQFDPINIIPVENTAPPIQPTPPIQPAPPIQSAQSVFKQVEFNAPFYKFLMQKNVAELRMCLEETKTAPFLKAARELVKFYDVPNFVMCSEIIPMFATSMGFRYNSAAHLFFLWHMPRSPPHYWDLPTASRETAVADYCKLFLD